MTTASRPEIERIEGSRLEVLLELLDTPAPSGYEGPAGEVFERYASEFAQVRRDGVGNRFATVGAGVGRRVMLMGHLDEIGFVVTQVEDSGLVRFDRIGGWDESVAVGQRVRVLTRDGLRPGVIGRLPPHQIDKEADGKIRFKDLWIDVGAVDGDELRELVRPGDPVVLDTRPHLFDNRRVMSRSADNRLGAFVALEAARRSAASGAEVVAVGSVSEETNQVGALAATYSTDPVEACVIDVTPTSDVPGSHDEVVEVGAGPVVTFGAASRSRVGRELLAVAAERGIDVQLSAAGSYTSTDADEVVMARAGVPTGVPSVPCRYLHSPGELFDLADVEATIALLVAWIARET